MPTIYQRDPYRNEMAGTIADLMLRQGQARASGERQVADIQARGALQQGQNRAQLIGSIGDLAARGVAGYFESQQREREMAPRREMEQIALSGARREEDAAREGEWNKRKAREALTQAIKAGDYSVLDELPPEVRQVADDYLADHAKLRQEQSALRDAGRKRMAQAIRDFGYDVDAAALVVGLNDDDPEAVRTFQQVGNDPAKLRQLVDHYAGPAPAPVYADSDPTKNRVRRDPVTGEETVVRPGVQARTFQAKDVLVGGRRTTANYDPKSGQYYDQAGQLLKDVEPIPPQSQQGGSGTPYFTYQPTFDAQGRPTGAIRFDARGGPPQFIDVSQMTNGGQIRQPPGTLGAQTITNEASEDQLSRLVDMFENQGGKDLVGPLEGRARSAGQKVPGVPVNKQFANFDAATAAFRNSVIKAITGAQMSEPEANRIRQQIPEVTDKPDVWRAKAEQTKKNLQDLKNRIAAIQAKQPGAPSPGGAADLTWDPATQSFVKKGG